MNNLFAFATSELSQDAFFAWLLAWADKSNAGTRMNECGRQFFNALILNDCGKSLSAECEVKVSRQYKNIDVFCRIGDDKAVIIEDKIGTSEHSDQLNRYRQAIVDEGFAPDNVICVYLKTRDQSNLSAVEKAGYKVIGRKDLLDFFHSQQMQDVVKANDILRDFVDNLDGVENLVNSYLSAPLDKWDWNAWIGFYVALQKHFDGQWDYVSNPSGGFLGFWWYCHGVVGGEVYLQLEMERACFKATVYEMDDADRMKWHWNKTFLEAGKALGIDVVYPSRLRRGGYMTVAILNGDSRVSKPDGTIDFEKTVDRLRDMEKVLAYALDHQAVN